MNIMGDIAPWIVGLRKRPFVPGVDGEGTVLPTPAGFTGYEYINLTGIVINDFTIVETPNRVPKQLTCRVKPGDISIAGGRTLTGNPIDTFTDLELQIVVTKANGDPVPDYFGYLEPVNDTAYNIYSDTKEGNYFGIIPVHEAAGYNVTLYARGKNGVNIRVNSLTKAITTTENELTTQYADSAIGNAANDGLSPFIITGTATYTNATKRVFGTGLFASYDHAAATSNICPIYNYNYMYFTGAAEGGFPAGRYKVASKISDDEIELESALGADYTGVTFSTGPKAVPATLSNKNWYVSGSWPSLQLEASRYIQYIYGYKDGFTLTSSDGSGYVIQSGLVSASLSPPDNHLFFMGNGTVDGEYLNKPYGRALASTKSGVIRHMLHNVTFTRPNSGINVEFNTTDSAVNFTCHHSFIGCTFDNRLKDRQTFTSAGNLTGTTDFKVNGVIPAETPLTGYLWFLDNTGRLLYGDGSKNRIAYTNWSETAGVYSFTLASATGRDCQSGNPVLTSDDSTKMYNAFVYVNNDDSTAGFVNNTFHSDVADDEKDHDLYISGYVSGSAVVRNTFGEGFAVSYGVNGNMKSGTEGYVHYNVVFADNSLSQHRRFGFDMSNTNGAEPLEFAKGVLVRGNTSNVLHCFMYHYAAHSLRISRNTHQNILNLGSQSDLWAMIVRSKWTTESPPDAPFRLVADNNECIDSRFLKYDQNEQALEIVDNDNRLDFDGECIRIDSTAYDGGVITGNNFYNPAQTSDHVALIDGVGFTIDEFNTAVNGVNTSINTGVPTQYSYDMSAETLGTGLPSFARMALGSAAATTEIISTTLSSGSAGKAWRIYPTTNSTVMSVIFDDIAKQTGDISMFAVLKGEVGGTNAIITRLATRIHEVEEVGQTLDFIHSGQRTSGGATELRIRSRVNNTTVINQIATNGPDESTWTTTWRKILVTHSSAGLIEVYEWAASGTKPATPNVTFDDTAANSLANAFVGLAGINDGRVVFEYISVGINGSPAVEI